MMALRLIVSAPTSARADSVEAHCPATSARRTIQVDCRRLNKVIYPPAQRGFILVATLWILAVITIATGYFAERVSRAIALAQQKQDAAEQLVEFANTRAEVLYRLGTVPISLSGVGNPPTAIALDDRPYRGSGNDVVRLQDMRGLLNVNFVEPTLLMNLLGQFGVPVDKRDALRDALLDYADEDDLRRLNGAETAEYKALGLPLPPNEWLITPHQLKNVIGWRDQASFWQEQRLLRLVTTARIVGFNPNTAPVELLAALPGITRETAAAIVKQRNETPLTTPAALPGFTPGLIDPDYFLFFPGNGIRITQQGGKLPWALQFAVTLTANNETAPWRIDYTSKTPVSYPIDNVEKFQKLPAATAKPPDASDML